MINYGRYTNIISYLGCSIPSRIHKNEGSWNENPEKFPSIIKINNEVALEMKNKNICCVCGHELAIHFDEGKGWRCHSLGRDGYQCECWLRKNQAKGNILFFDLNLRVKEQIKELEKIQ